MMKKYVGPQIEVSVFDTNEAILTASVAIKSNNSTDAIVTSLGITDEVKKMNVNDVFTFTF